MPCSNVGKMNKETRIWVFLAHKLNQNSKSGFLISWYQLKLCEKCQYLEFFWSLFSRIRSEYGDIRCISPYSVQIRGNMDQKNSEYDHFSRNVMAPNQFLYQKSHCHETLNSCEILFKTTLSDYFWFSNHSKQLNLQIFMEKFFSTSK